MRTPFFSGLACTACLCSALMLSACSPSSTTVIIPEPESEVSTNTITPIERGNIRRNAEASAREAIDAWIAGDREAFKEHFGELPQELMFQQWDADDAAGYTVERDHEVTTLSVFDMNSTGTQVLVKYRFNDNTVVRDSSGEVIGGAGGIEGDFQLTMEPSEDDPKEWIVVRMIGTKESIR